MPLTTDQRGARQQLELQRCRSNADRVGLGEPPAPSVEPSAQRERSIARGPVRRHRVPDEEGERREGEITDVHEIVGQRGMNIERRRRESRIASFGGDISRGQVGGAERHSTHQQPPTRSQQPGALATPTAGKITHAGPPL